MPKYFDVHSHLNFYNYQNDFDEVIERLREAETQTIVIGTDLESSTKAVELADKYPEVYASIGVHPVDKLESFEVEKFESLVQTPKAACKAKWGIDLYHAKKVEDYKRQEELFSTQIDFALKHHKPLMIHARDAYEELLNILEPLKKIHGEKLRGNIHFFAGNLDIAKRFYAIGFTTSFTGVITFVSNYDEVIKNAPLNMLLSETDAPYVAPVPYRGKRNEPSYVQEVVKRIAEIRGEDLEMVRSALVENALNMLR